MMVDNSALVVGIDFGAPRRTRHQRRKIVAVAARATDPLLQEREGVVWVPSFTR